MPARLIGVMNHVVRVQGLAVVRGGREVFSGLDLAIGSGQRVGVLGPNGVGKSTLAAILAARLRPSAGSVEILGRTVGKVDIRSVRSQIGFFSDELARQLAPETTAVEAIAMGRYAGLRAAWFQLSDQERLNAAELLRVVGLFDKRDSPVSEFSSGQRQRILLARAFFGSPRLIVLDEPASHLDFGAREDMIGSLEALMARDGGPDALLVVSHHTEEIPASVSHILLLGPGFSVFGPREEVLTAGMVSKVYGRPVALASLLGRTFAVAEPRLPDPL